GHPALRGLQSSLSAMEKGLGGLKKAGQKLSETETAQKAKSKLGDLWEDTKIKALEKSGLDKVLGQMEGGDWSEKLKSGGAEAQEKVWNALRDAGGKGFEAMLYKETQEWILKVSGKILEREVTGLKDVNEFNDSDRAKLIEALYPHGVPLYNQWIKRFDSAFNFGLGAIAASQFPGTGILASGANLVKTLFQAANRINILAAIYGHRIHRPSELFRASAIMIASLEDFETNKGHKPLGPDTLASLFTAGEEDPKAFANLVSEAIKKDAYMAIPGVGVISIGKVALDDFKLDEGILNWFQAYYLQGELEKELEPDTFTAALGNLQAMSQELVEEGFLTAAEPDQGGGFMGKLKSIKNIPTSWKEKHYKLDEESLKRFEEALK
ncbi:MAG: hypothetical protein QNL04_09385, partial [SAR324 cluster bacterium]|nr:hypothetical protein [SAR324 cluster bacterium]